MGKITGFHVKPESAIGAIIEQKRCKFICKNIYIIFVFFRLVNLGTDKDIVGEGAAEYSCCQSGAVQGDLDRAESICVT